ncbi:hypothetical protein CC79DRAFT_1327670 [Sarocladium strictum]
MESPISYRFLRLATKPTAELSYSFLPGTGASPQGAPLLVFINGLGLPQVSWTGVIHKLRELRPDSCPPILTYDRFGQGQTVDRDPNDEGAEDPMHAHDCLAAVGDLRQLIKQIAAEELKVDDVDSLPLVLVGNSVGCALARIYAQQHKGTVAGVVLLDSVLANSDFVSIIPDPDSPDFNPSEPLPEGITVEQLREARAVLDRTFHPKNGSKEGLSRKNLAALLPHADEPKLPGIEGEKGPFLTVVGHDFETFAQGSLAIGMPYSISIHYVNPYWHKYNQGLARLTEGGRSKGPLIASAADHFIQRDRPHFVAVEVSEVLDKIAGELGVVTRES